MHGQSTIDEGQVAFVSEALYGEGVRRHAFLQMGSGRACTLLRMVVEEVSTIETRPRHLPYSKPFLAFIWHELAKAASS